MSRFIPMYDLEKLNETDRQQYYLAACEYLGLPPELNVLAFHFMDQGDGARKLILYAKRGATDIIRNNLGISVVGLTKDQNAHEVTWVATGKNKDGRTEMSSGSKSIDGLRGKALEDAIAWAQTKALRRMTLQFAGGGILDETEIAEPTTMNIAQAPSLAQAAAQPTVQPNAAPGKLFENTEPPPKEKETRRFPATFDKPFVLTPIPDTACAQGVTQPTGPGWTLFGEDEEFPKHDAQGNPVFDDGCPVTGNIVKDIGHTMTFKVGPSIPAEITEAANQIHMPDAAQKKAYREKLRTYNDDILPKAGMMPNEHGGIGMRLRAFAMKRYNVAEISQLFTWQWEDFFKFLESKTPAELVKAIDANI